MMGVLFSLVAGILVCLQGVFNTRVSDKVGLWETTAIVHATGLFFVLLIILFWGKGNIRKLGEVNKIYLLGGILGVIIVFSVMKGISLLGAGFSVAILLITQLIVATIIDSFGLFGCPQIKFHITKLLGVVIMVIGIIIFKLKG